MFLFLFLSSRSMMKCCVLTGSMIRLGIVLLSPHSQALRPGHAAAVRHLGGFPRYRAFYTKVSCCYGPGLLGCISSSAQTEEEAPLPPPSPVPPLLLLPHC